MKVVRRLTVPIRQRGQHHRHWKDGRKIPCLLKLGNVISTLSRILAIDAENLLTSSVLKKIGVIAAPVCTE